MKYLNNRSKTFYARLGAFLGVAASIPFGFLSLNAQAYRTLANYDRLEAFFYGSSGTPIQYQTRSVWQDFAQPYTQVSGEPYYAGTTGTAINSQTQVIYVYVNGQAY